MFSPPPFPTSNGLPFSYPNLLQGEKRIGVRILHWGSSEKQSPLGFGETEAPSHLHLEMEVRTCHALLVVLVEMLVLGHHEVVLPVPGDSWR